MDNKSLFDNFVGLISKEVVKESPPSAEQSDEHANMLIETLKVFSGQSSEDFGKELNEFLNSFNFRLNSYCYSFAFRQKVSR